VQDANRWLPRELRSRNQLIGFHLDFMAAAIFQADTPQHLRERALPCTRTHREEFTGDTMDSVAQIGPSIRIKGDITAQEPLTIAGQVTGNIDVSGYALAVTEGGRVNADVLALTMVISGVVNGRLCAERGIVVHRTATVVGELAAPSVSVVEGAQLQGKCEIAGTRGVPVVS
jgi:cytoskeletal protein CcmA (bactofilin family)